MSAIVRSNAWPQAASGSGSGLSKSEQRAFRGVEMQGALDRQHDVELGRSAANRTDLYAAVGANAMTRVTELSDHRQSLTNGDPAREMELAPIQQAVTRGICGEISGMFGPLGRYR